MSVSPRSPFPREDPYRSPGFSVSPVQYMVFETPLPSPEAHGSHNRSGKRKKGEPQYYSYDQYMCNYRAKHNPQRLDAELAGKRAMDNGSVSPVHKRCRRNRRASFST